MAINHESDRITREVNPGQSSAIKCNQVQSITNLIVLHARSIQGNQVQSRAINHEPDRVAREVEASERPVAPHSPRQCTHALIADPVACEPQHLQELIPTERRCEREQPLIPDAIRTQIELHEPTAHREQGAN